MHIFTMLALLSVLVLVHELGHFGVARFLGFKVSRFGFGLPFGPTLFERKFGDLKVCIHALLLGGYVSFPDDDPECDLPEDDPGRFANKEIWKRFLVVIAGVTANVFIAYLLVLFVALGSGKMPSGNYNVFVNDIQKGQQYAASSIGMKPNDKILEVNGININSPYQFTNIVQKSKKFDGYVEHSKIDGYENKLITLNPQLKNYQENKPLPSGLTLQLPESTYEKGIKISEDKIKALYGYKPSGYKLTESQIKLRDSLDEKNNLVTDGNISIFDIAVAKSDNAHPVNITVLRDGEKIQLPSAYPNKEGLIGIKLQMEEIKVNSQGFLPAVKESWNYLYKNTEFMLKGLYLLFSGKIPISEMHGIVAITKIGSDMIEKKGIWDGLLLTALISMDLAIVNLLPIPALDGGHVIFLLLEKLRGRPLEERIQENIAKISFFFLIGLMILIVLNDVVALITDKF